MTASPLCQFLRQSGSPRCWFLILLVGYRAIFIRRVHIGYSVLLLFLPLETWLFYAKVDALIWSNEAWDALFFRQSAHMPSSLAATFAPRLLFVFSVTQALHYFVWLRAIPDAHAAHNIPRSFRFTWRALKRNVGTPMLALWVVATLGLFVLAAADLERAKEAYLAFALAHAIAEIFALCLRPLGEAHTR